MSGDLDLSGFAGDEETAPATLAESEEAHLLKNKVWEAVDSLSGQQRAAIILFYRENLSCQDIAEVMTVPVATVKSHLFRARNRLKEILEPVFAGDSSKLRIFSEAIG